MDIRWTYHALVRLAGWRDRIGVSRGEVERLLRDPAQIVPGRGHTWIAQTRRGRGLLRVAFRDLGPVRRVLTLYWTTKVDKYWEGQSEDGP